MKMTRQHGHKQYDVDFPTIRAKALLSQHREVEACPVCKTDVPKAAMRDVGRHVNGDFVLMGQVCGSCHYVFNKMWLPIASSLEGENECRLH